MYTLILIAALIAGTPDDILIDKAPALEDDCRRVGAIWWADMKAASPEGVFEFWCAKHQ